MAGTRWDFRTLAPVFDDHIQRSIPLTDPARAYIAELAGFFLREDATVYELGTSTGALAERVLAANPTPAFRYVGLDNTDRMVATANRRLAHDPRYEAVEADITDFAFQPCALVLAHYTLHFLPLEERRALVRRIHRALEDGGALVLHEKVRCEDPEIEGIVSTLHDRYKQRSGFTRQQIENKRQLLSGVLQPLTGEQNLEMLRDAGFERMERIHRFHCFEGYLAIK